MARRVPTRPAAVGGRVGRRLSAGLLGGSLAFVALAAIGAEATSDPAWYATLDLPGWAPDASALRVAWLALYPLMAVAAWLVARLGLDRSGVALALLAYIQQLGLNAAWTPVFSGLHAPGWALAVIVALVLALGLAVVLAARVHRVAGLLLLPCLACALLVAAVNAAVVV